MIARALVALALFIPSLVLAQPAPDSTATDYVTFKGGRTLYEPVRIIRDSGGDATHIAVGDSVYEVDQALVFQSAGSHYELYGTNVSRNTVVDVEEYILQRTEQGPLDLYARVDGAPLAPNASYPYDYFSANGERPQRTSISNLRNALSHHSEAARHIQNARKYELVQRGLLVVGGSVLAYGMVYHLFGEADSDGELPRFGLNAFQPIGLTLMLSALYPANAKTRARREAVQAYQRQ